MQLHQKMFTLIIVYTFCMRAASAMDGLLEDDFNGHCIEPDCTINKQKANIQSKCECGKEFLYVSKKDADNFMKEKEELRCLLRACEYLRTCYHDVGVLKASLEKGNEQQKHMLVTQIHRKMKQQMAIFSSPLYVNSSLMQQDTVYKTSKMITWTKIKLVTKWVRSLIVTSGSVTGMLSVSLNPTEIAKVWKTFAKELESVFGQTKRIYKKYKSNAANLKRGTETKEYKVEIVDCDILTTKIPDVNTCVPEKALNEFIFGLRKLYENHSLFNKRLTPVQLNEINSLRLELHTMIGQGIDVPRTASYKGNELSDDINANYKLRTFKFTAEFGKLSAALETMAEFKGCKTPETHYNKMYENADCDCKCKEADWDYKTLNNAVDYISCHIDIGKCYEKNSKEHFLNPKSLGDNNDPKCNCGAKWYNVKDRKFRITGTICLKEYQTVKKIYDDILKFELKKGHLLTLKPLHSEELKHELKEMLKVEDKRNIVVGKSGKQRTYVNWDDRNRVQFYEPTESYDFMNYLMISVGSVFDNKDRHLVSTEDQKKKFLEDLWLVGHQEALRRHHETILRKHGKQLERIEEQLNMNPIAVRLDRASSVAPAPVRAHTV